MDFFRKLLCIYIVFSFYYNSIPLNLMLTRRDEGFGPLCHKHGFGEKSFVELAISTQMIRNSER